MEIKKRNRAELKSYFVKNAIPTETNFADLMDAVLIQKSDGVAKLPGDPLSIEAVGDDNSRKPALSFYRSFTQPAPSWRLELNPWGAPNDPATAAAGLSISDGAGNSRLFVSASTGSVGVGTVAPGSSLHVYGASAVATVESTTAESSLRIQTSEGAANRVAVANRAGGRLALATGGADALTILRDGKIGVRTDTPQRALHVASTGELLLGAPTTGVQTDSKAGLYWYTTDEYSIRRGAGAWSAPDYQQLVVQWSTGIVLTPGTGPDAGYGRSFVEIRGGKGLRVTDGGVVIGPGDPAGSKLKVSASATDFVSTNFTGAGMGELRFAGWSNGWSFSAINKHLYINRDSPATSNLYLGRVGAELTVLATGTVTTTGSLGVGADPAGARFKVQCSPNDIITMLANAQNTNAGELRFGSWDAGWNINAMSKNLYLNRDSGATSNVLIGRVGAELQVLASGTVQTFGSLGIGADPGGARLKVQCNPNDVINMFANAQSSNAGELRFISWDAGWNINAMAKNLYLNRDAGATSNVYIGRVGAELQVLASGDVGIGGAPGTKLHVYGDSTVEGVSRSWGGLRIDGDLQAHVEADGSFYRYQGQVYITVDDNLYIRDRGGAIKFWFDTDGGVLRQDDWVAAPLQQNWVNYGAGYNDAAYFRDRQGMVHLRGLVKNGAAGGNQTIFQLPAGFRPPNRQLHMVQTSDTLGRVDVTADGRVIPYNVNNVWVSLDGISFRVV